MSLPLPHNARVCSAHFQPADFCGLKGLSNTKPRLKEDAVPSLLLNPDPNFAVKRRKIVAVTAANPGLQLYIILIPIIKRTKRCQIHGGPLGMSTLQQAVRRLDPLYNMCTLP